VLARTGEQQVGCRIVFDRKLPVDGMSLRRHGQEFLDLVDEVERYSRDGGMTDPLPEEKFI
jgi:hypothetical protein